MSSSPYAAEDAGALHLDRRAELSNAWPRYANILLGLWLFASAFAWPHTRDECGASWIMGGMIAMNAFASIWASPVRFFNVLLGGMSLVWQAAAAEHDPLTWRNGVAVSLLVVLLSLVPSGRRAGW